MSVKVEVKRDFYTAAQKYLKKDLLNRATWLVEEAKQNAPVVTGRLRDSIRMAEQSNGYAVGSDVEYSGYVEYGTIKQAPQAYLRRALGRLISSWKR